MFRSSTSCCWIGRRRDSMRFARRSWFQNLRRNLILTKNEFVKLVFFFFFTWNKRVAGFESSRSSGDGRTVEMQRHDGRIGHEFTRRTRAAKIINLLFVAANWNEGRHAVRTVAAALNSNFKMKWNWFLDAFIVGWHNLNTPKSHNYKRRKQKKKI